MSFVRTSSGESNMHKFYGVDLIIYTEGGSKSFSIEEVDKGKHTCTSVDIKFWSGILKTYQVNKTFQLRAVGSKTASKIITQRINDGTVKNVAVAKDRDLDGFLSNIEQSPYILYTKGYSWENDVFTLEQTLRQIEKLAMQSSIPDEYADEIKSSFKDFERLGKSLAKLEIIFRHQGIRFISDINGERFFNSKSTPKIEKAEVYKHLSSKKKSLARPIKLGLKLKGVCPFYHNYGKLISALSMSAIQYVGKKKLGYKSIPIDITIAQMISDYITSSASNKDKYYEELVGRLNAS